MHIISLNYIEKLAFIRFLKGREVMKRFILDDLRKWKDSKRRKPLIVKGARQVGKTWALQEFGKEFDGGFAYFNFDKDIEYKQFLKKIHHLWLEFHLRICRWMERFLMCHYLWLMSWIG